MNEPILPIPDDIRHMVLKLWGLDLYEDAMRCEQAVFGDISIRACIALGRNEEVRRVLHGLIDGVHP